MTKARHYPAHMDVPDQAGVPEHGLAECHCSIQSGLDELDDFADPRADVAVALAAPANRFERPEPVPASLIDVPLDFNGDDV